MVDIELVGSCNYRCRMCPHTDPGRDSDFLKVLPWNLFTNIIDQCCDLGLKHVRLHGSGEPSLYKRLPDAVEYCSSRGLTTLITTNGYRLNQEVADKLINAGVSKITISATGYDSATYHHWMGVDHYYKVRENVKYLVEQHVNVSLYHLIIDPEQIDFETVQYRNNWEQYTGAQIEIWQMHNWSGNYKQPKLIRHSNHQRSCGRMFKPVLEVRAGGIDDHYGAVVACCMVLGNDRSAVLGHLDCESVSNIWYGERYQQLRDAHASGQWNQIDYCKNCDQLYDYPESLIYSSVPNRTYNQIKFI